jgi:hypothetical protein
MRGWCAQAGQNVLVSIAHIKSGRFNNCAVPRTDGLPQARLNSIGAHREWFLSRVFGNLCLRACIFMPSMSAIFLAESSCKRQLKRYIDFMSSNSAIGRTRLGNYPHPDASGLCARIPRSESADPIRFRESVVLQRIAQLNCNSTAFFHLIAPNRGKMA